MKKILISAFQQFFSIFGFVLVKNSPNLNRERNINLSRETDFVRVSSLELVSEEIYNKKVEGNVAELGVYRGDFAGKINELFKDRTFYLFDTFEGFDERDITSEINNDYSKGNQDFSKTSIELVLKKMSFPSNCIIKKGFFPESSNGLIDTFCFVSIDTDLFEPIYNGLVYFYPKLSKGGYIFVHDYNNKEYFGAKEAVRKFCTEFNVPYFPLTDNWGSVVISK